MKSVRAEGCHVGLFREFVRPACCTLVLTDSRIRPVGRVVAFKRGSAFIMRRFKTTTRLLVCLD